MKLHESVEHTRKEMTVKENDGFRLRLIKHKVLSPDGLMNIDLVRESLENDGTVSQRSTYNFFMTKEELQLLAQGLTA